MARRSGSIDARMLTAALGVLAAIAVVVPAASATATAARAANSSAAKPAHVTVSKPVAIDRLSKGYLLAVSCPSTHFCAAVGLDGDVLLAKHGPGKWSAPTLLESKPIDVNDLSCTSAKFCVATTYNGAVLTYDGQRWSAPQRIRTKKQHPLGIVRPVVFCISKSFCMVVSQEGEAFRYNGHSWSAASTIETGANVNGLSCSSRSFCVATDGVEGDLDVVQGSVVTFHGSGWSKPKLLDKPHGLDAVSCASPTFCAALGATHAFMLSKHGWSKPKPVGGIDDLNAVSCPTAKHCEATGDAGDVSRLHGATWSLGQPVDTAPRSDLGPQPAISCGSATSCAIVDTHGRAVALKDRTWTAPQAIDPRHGGLINVSCATATFCAGVDQHGGVVQYDGKHWTAVHELDRDVLTWPYFTYDPNVTGLALISCPAPTFCVAANRDDSDVPARAYSFDGLDWSAPTEIDSDAGLTGLSCTSSSFCMAIDGGGRFMTFNGATWSAPTTFDPGQYPQAVSCTSAAFCVAVDDGGPRGQPRALVDRSGDWGTPVLIGTRGRHHTIDAVSCATPTYCAAIGYFGAAAVFNGTTWTRIEPPAKPDHTVTVSVSCLPSNRCEIAGETSMELIGDKLSKPFALKARGVSCPTEHHCIAINGNYRGDAYVLKLAS